MKKENKKLNELNELELLEKLKSLHDKMILMYKLLSISLFMLGVVIGLMLGR